MGIEQELQTRSESKCELCGAENGLAVYDVPPTSDGTIDQAILICQTCQTQIDDPAKVDANHWRCLNDSMWTPVPAVQVVAWRMLDRLRGEGWPQDLLDMLYLEDEVMSWAKAGAESGAADQNDDEIRHLDSNGALLLAGDTVTLIKDLNVKGANFTAKRGTAVRNISLVHDNAEQIEGRVSGQHIVILTQFVKKST
ncbi:MAG: alkylphosphonate utilization protein [Emcibacter sp.]|nr:alkylphosphonate utilization protein [Emcibacter sp.]